MAHVVLNVCGTKFEVLVATLLNSPDTMLGSLVDKWNQAGEFADSAAPTREVFIDRNGERFQYILDWYRDGRIMLPSHVPRESMESDIQFFGLPPDAIAPPSRNKIAVLTCVNGRSYIEGANIPGTDTLHRSVWGCPIINNNMTPFQSLSDLAADGFELVSTQKVPHPTQQVADDIIQYIFRSR
eukprot:Rhum_TRINITY_DN25246_c0_g1::Rhum_TRINITY_DN25246_c0_g1_i1::g.181609::m.181609